MKRSPQRPETGRGASKDRGNPLAQDRRPNGCLLKVKEARRDRRVIGRHSSQAKAGSVTRLRFSL
jgi:hypothetical protein